MKVSVLLLFFVLSAAAQETDPITVILENCRMQTTLTRYYDPSYVALQYPMGDLDISRGVCTDVVVRALRSVGVDLQELIHEDMSANFSEYPDNWGLVRPDPNIDHRRVPNITTYLRRMGKELTISHSGDNYLPGDIVTWKLPGNLDHIGIVSDTKVEGQQRCKIYHNIGNGTQLEDILFRYRITGHFRYFSVD
ncbi:NADH:ubiquinone oxidoreductase [Chitinispirillum alkaliphilum]|nr:NADH:ubiquinone oxidoreductase [Chitinispirillum alkaliphilum]